MRVLWTLLLLVPLAGCFGPYASDLELPPPEPRPVDGVWDFAADATDVSIPNSTGLPSPIYYLTGHQGAEPNIGTTSSGAMFITSYDTTLKSVDAGRTWEPVFDFAPGTSTGGVDTGDPMLWVDAETDRVYVNHMYPALVCFYTAWSDDEGTSWDENSQSCTFPGVDHQKFFTSLPGPTAPAIAGDAYPTVAYQCYQRIVDAGLLVPQAAGLAPGVGGFTTHCNMSYDGGATWPVETSSHQDVIGCGGINGHGAAAPDGTIALPVANGCNTLHVAISTDNGLSFLDKAVPGGKGAEGIDPDLTFTADGTLYAIWRGSDHLPYLARSSDLGDTWDGPWRVSPPHVTSTVFQVIGSGDDGKIAMAFLGTDDWDGEASFADENTTWDLYVVSSLDAAEGTPSLRAQRVNVPNDPVQIGCVWLYGGGNPCRNMLDFIDATVTPTGEFFVAFTKGCEADCSGRPGATPDDSRSAATAVATLRGVDLIAE